MIGSDRDRGAFDQEVPRPDSANGKRNWKSLNHPIRRFIYSRRKKNNNKEGGQKGKLGLNYETEQFYQHKDTHPDVKNKTFNNYTERTAFAQKQMETIG